MSANKVRKIRLKDAGSMTVEPASDGSGGFVVTFHGWTERGAHYEIHVRVCRWAINGFARKVWAGLKKERERFEHMEANTKRHLRGEIE